MITTNKIDSYGKYKISQEASVIDFITTYKKLIAICSDKTIKVWDIDTYNALKGVTLTEYGKFICLALSKNEDFLLCGTA